MENNFDFTVLEGAEVGEEMNPVMYDEGDYTPLETILEHVLNNDPEKAIDVKTLLPQMSKSGVVIDDEMKTYLSFKACSSSALKQALISPRHYLIATQEPQIKKERDHFNLGTFCHLAFLQPDLFDSLVVEPDASMSSKEGVSVHIAFWEKECKKVEKATGKRILSYAKKRRKKKGLDPAKMDGAKYYLSELKRLSGKEPIDAYNFGVIELVKRSYYDYGGGIIPRLMKGAASEVSFYGKDPETGLKVKVRPDAFQVEENIGCNTIISLKTTSAETLSKFQYDCAKYHYQMAEGMYLEVASHVTGRKFTAVINIMIQTCAPFLPAVFLYSPEDLANGKYRYRLAKQNVKEAQDKDMWPGFETFAEPGNYGIINMKLPEWSLKEALPQSIDV